MRAAAGAPSSVAWGQIQLAQKHGEHEGRWCVLAVGRRQGAGRVRKRADGPGLRGVGYSIGRAGVEFLKMVNGLQPLILSCVKHTLMLPCLGYRKMRGYIDVIANRRRHGATAAEGCAVVREADPVGYGEDPRRFLGHGRRRVFGRAAGWESGVRQAPAGRGPELGRGAGGRLRPTLGGCSGSRGRCGRPRAGKEYLAAPQRAVGGQPGGGASLGGWWQPASERCCRGARRTSCILDLNRR
jgi:hypothetical protein